MSAALLAEAQAAGMSLSRIGEDHIAWKCQGDPPADLLNRIRAAKPALLAALQTEATERWRDEFEERSALREHDGGLSRDEAEAAALGDLALRWRSAHPLAASRPTDPCICCNEPMSQHDRTPVLARDGHAWMHARCRAPMNEKRQREALDAVTRMLNASKNNA